METFAIPNKTAAKSAGLKDVIYETSSTISPCSTAPGKISGIVHDHKFFIKNRIRTNIAIIKAIISGIKANNYFFFIIFLSFKILNNQRS